MKLLGDHDTAEKETTIFRTALGHSFKGERNIFKNIHSLLKKPKKQEEDNLRDGDHHNDSDPGKLELYNQEDEISLTIELSPVAVGRARKSAEVKNSGVSASPTPGNDLAINWPDGGSLFQLASPNTHDGLLAISPPVGMSRSSSMEQSISPTKGMEPDEDDIFLHNLLPPQFVRPRPQRKASHNSVGSSSGSRAKRDGKSLRGSRTSLYRMNSLGHRDLALTQSEDQQSSTLPARKAYQSTISESGIPFYNHDGSAGDHFPRITAHTLKRIIQDGIHKSHYDSYQVIDCRFDYEFKGGHINDAMNVSSREELEKEFIHDNQKPNTLLIFHCEFSSYRGPLLASHLRNCDRMLNYENYPALFYPDILVLDGGYKGFFDQFPSLCFPRKYVGMDSSENLASRDQELDRFRNDSKKVVSRNSSLYKLTSVSSSTRSSIKQGHRDKNCSSAKLDYTASPGFKYEAPPKLSISRYSSDNLFGNSDDNSSASRLSINSSPNLSTSKMLLMDGLDEDSCYSYEEGDSTFTTPVATMSTPSNRQNESGNASEASALNPIKKSLFSNILREEEEEIE